MTIPVLPLRGITVLPGMLIHFDLERAISIDAANYALENDLYIFITNQKDENIDNPKFHDLQEVGVIAKVKQIVKIREDVIRVMVSTVQRGVIETLTQSSPFMIGEVESYHPTDAEVDHEFSQMSALEMDAATRILKELFSKYMEVNPKIGKTVYDRVMREFDLGKVTDLITMNLNISAEVRQEFLECFSITRRYDKLVELITKEIDIEKIQTDFKKKVKQEMEESQKKYFLNQQMKVIRDELGERDHQEEVIEKYRKKLEEIECSDEIREKISEEIDHLSTLSGSSSEYSFQRGYVDTLTSLPWDKKSVDNLDLTNAQQILDDDHYGLEKVKERILEFLAVRKRLGDRKGESPIICLVGPPGTGKTSIAKSVARSLEKEYVRICLGGVRDEAEIRGHRRTYVGSMPGRLINGIIKAKVSNPLILLDEIDKVSKDYRGDTSAALLEVLDPEQNKNFVDHYVELPVDLSDVFFICTANSLDTISRPLLDRMEVIQLSGYTEQEKFQIAKKYLVKKQIEKNGLLAKECKISDAVIRKVIRSYTREAGVRELERKIGTICRKVVWELTSKEVSDEKKDSTVKAPEKISISGKNLSDYLGKEKYREDDKKKPDDIGIVTGLAWTSVGGDTLEIEVNTMPGTGKLELTGKLGDVMKESASIALSYIRSQESLHGKDGEWFAKNDIHIHVPEGAVPKDGPSAGVTMATALFSAVSGKKVRGDIAMTGEITLRGRVLAIGGLKEKLLAAKAAGMKTVFVPKQNKADVAEIDKEIIDGLEIVLVEQVKEIWKKGIVNYES